MKYEDVYNNPQLLYGKDKIEIEGEGDPLIIEELKKCVNSFPYFLSKYVYTIDNNDPTTKYKKFPYPEEIEWPGVLSDVIEKHNICYIVKSRQVLGSWFLVAYAVWKCAFGNTINVHVQSFNKKSSEELIARAKVIVDMLPDFIVKRIDGEMGPRFTKERIEFQKTGSKLEALPNTPYALRSLTAGLVIIDEASLHRELEQVLESAAPMASKIIVMGTPAFGTPWYHRFFPSDYAKKTLYKDKFKEITRGVYVYSKEGEARIQLHYTADPKKYMGSKWYKEKKRTLSEAQFNQEYELQWISKGNNIVKVQVEEGMFK